MTIEFARFRELAAEMKFRGPKGDEPRTLSVQMDRILGERRHVRVREINGRILAMVFDPWKSNVAVASFLSAEPVVVVAEDEPALLRILSTVGRERKR